jgi:hypothetical protein
MRAAQKPVSHFSVETHVIPAQAGIQFVARAFTTRAERIPAFAGMTSALSARVSQMTKQPPTSSGSTKSLELS